MLLVFLSLWPFFFPVWAIFHLANVNGSLGDRLVAKHPRENVTLYSALDYRKAVPVLFDMGVLSAPVTVPPLPYHVLRSV